MRDLEGILGQSEIIKEITTWLENANQESHVFVIRGDSGTGKTHIVKRVNELWLNQSVENKSIYVEGDLANSERSLFPFIKGIEKGQKVVAIRSTIEKGIAEAVKGIPFAGDFVSYLVDLLANREENQTKTRLSYLSSQEQEVLLSLNTYYRQSSLLLIAENFHWWDQTSINLLSFILSGTLNDLFPVISKMKIVLIITEDQIDRQTSKIIDSFLSKHVHTTATTKVLGKEGFLSAFQLLGGEQKINLKTQNLLFSLTGGHLELIKKLASLPDQNLDDYESMFTNETFDHAHSQQAFLEKILITRLQFLGAEAEQIIKVLEYASVIGLTFSYEEILCLVKGGEEKLKTIILRAKDASLLDSDTSQNRFSHEVIREFFICRIGTRKHEYYKNFAACLNVLRPSEYFERANLLFDAGQVKESLILYIVGYLKNLRAGLLVPTNAVSRIENLGEEYHLLEYYLTMRAAYMDFHKGKYQFVCDRLETLEDTYSDVLVAEKYYLLSLCSAKTLKSDDLLRAKNYLLEWDKLKNIESEVWVRIMLTLMSRHAHLNEYSQAELIERKLMSFLVQRVPFDKDAQYGLNVLRRKASILHSSEIACHRTEDCLNYFGYEVLPGTYRNPMQYFMALTNHSGNLIMAGNFTTANSTAQDSLALQKIYPELVFPRIEVPVNNYIVSGFLSKNLSANQCIQLFDSLFLNINNPNDRILLRSNYIIMYALSGKIQEALEMSHQLLELLSKSTRNDSYYNYFVGINHAVLIYLEEGKYKAIELLNSLSAQIPSIPDKVFVVRRHQLIETLFKTSKVTDPQVWYDHILSIYPQELGSSWKFWGKGFLFTDMQFWSDS